LRQVVQFVIDSLSVGSLYALLSLGIALVFGIMGLINFAYGELIVASGYTLAIVSAGTDVVRILPVILVAVVLSLLLERIAFRPLRGAPPDTLLVASFAVSFFLQSLAILIFGSLPRSTGVLLGLSKPVEVLGYPVRKLDLVTIGITAVMLALLVVLLKRTSIGIQMRASAENFNMARLLGVRANRVIAFAFALSGLLAAVATIILVAQTGLVGPTMGAGPLLAAFVATIVGGLGTLTGAVLGAYVLGGVTVLLQVTLPESLRPYRDAFVFVALVAILVARPQGLLGAAAQRV
jgi:branched-chain amino acid transport system permease protein